MHQIHVCAIQQPCNLDRQANIDLSIAKIKEAAALGSNLVVLPELHLDPYFCQTENHEYFKLAETIPGATTKIFSKLAQKYKLVIICSLFEKRATGLYHNTAVVLDTDGNIAGIYRKMHIPDDPGFYEKYYFTPGDIGFNPIQTSIGKLGVLICWDQWFPEAARLMALAGAEILIYPTAIGWDPSENIEEQQRQLQAWITIQRGHAIANGIPVIACNRIEFEWAPNQNSGINFWGNSFIAGPQGEILCAATDRETKLLTASINHRQSEITRQIWPFFRDRRIENYSELIKRFID
jgi:N-carbamoylputrescine amidase